MSRKRMVADGITLQSKTYYAQSRANGHYNPQEIAQRLWCCESHAQRGEGAGEQGGLRDLGQRLLACRTQEEITRALRADLVTEQRASLPPDDRQDIEGRVSEARQPDQRERGHRLLRQAARGTDYDDRSHLFAAHREHGSHGIARHG